LRDDQRHRGPQLVQGARALRDMRVHPAQGVGRLKGVAAGQQPVEHRAQRVEIGGHVHKAVEAPGEFGRHAGRIDLQGAVARQVARVFVARAGIVEAAQAGALQRGIPEDGAGRHVAMHQTQAVHLVEPFGNVDTQAQRIV